MPSLEFPPLVSPVIYPVRMERVETSTARERSLWVDHAVQGYPLPSKDTNGPESRGLSRW